MASSTRRQLFPSNSPVKKLFDDDGPIDMIDVPSISDITPPCSPPAPRIFRSPPSGTESDEEPVIVHSKFACPPTPNRPKIFSRSPLSKEHVKPKVKSRRMSEQSTLHINYRPDVEMVNHKMLAASCSVPDLRVTPAIEETEDPAPLPRPTGTPHMTPLRVLKYKTNVNPFSPSRGYPTAKGEFQIPTERESVPRYVSDFEQHHDLGKGSFGTVVLCLNRTDGWTYAIKKLTYTTEKMKDNFLQEAYALAALGQHPNIVRYYGSWEDKTISAIYIQVEWCKGGSLKKHHAYHWDQTTICKIIRQVCLALSYMHARGFSHGDVKPENILVDSASIDDSTVYKLCDLGQINGSGDGKYIAPEILQSDDDYLKRNPTVAQRGDIFSLGISVYELAYYYGQKSYQSPPRLSQLSPEDIVLPKEYFSEDFIILVKQMLSDSEQRPTADRILLHPLIRDNFEWQLEQERKKVAALQDHILQLERELSKARKHRTTKRSKFDMMDLRRNINGLTLAPPKSFDSKNPDVFRDIANQYGNCNSPNMFCKNASEPIIMSYPSFDVPLTPPSGKNP